MTARDDTVDKLCGFKDGNIDYITKPFDVIELIAPINTHLRNYQLLQNLQARTHELATILQFSSSPVSTPDLPTLGSELLNQLKSVVSIPPEQ